MLPVFLALILKSAREGAACEAVGKYLVRAQSVLNHKGIVRNFLCIPGPKADVPQQ
jgi:hypothetical protein